MAHHINIEERVHPLQKGLNKIVHDINEKVRHLPTLYPEYSCIYKVHEGLRKSNPDAYTPMLVSIGPYHHGKPSLHGMEEHKLRYLHSLLERRKETSVEKYILALAELEDGARKCYADPVDDLNSDEFVEMMLLDGIFIIEFVRKWESGDGDDPIFKADWMSCQICRDLILLENQLPYSVLSKLYNMTKDPEQNIVSFLKSAESVLKKNDVYSTGMPPEPYCSWGTRLDTHPIKHLLDLVHIFCSPPEPSEGKPIKSQLRSVIELQEFGIDFHKVPGKDPGNDLSGTTTTTNLLSGSSSTTTTNLLSGSSSTTTTATTTYLFDINFNKNSGVMEIPCFTVDDYTETFFRNMIAYEQYSSNATLKYFTDYACIMDQIISSKEDVKVLRLRGIIINLLGEDREVSRLFNKLGEGVINSSHFYYFKVCEEVNKHCEKGWNAWMAMLRRNYFSNPWAGIGTVAGTMVIIITFVQMILTLIAL